MSTKKKKSKPLRYFFFDGDLHKKIQINRGADIIVAWNYPQAAVVKHSYSRVRREGEKAFSTRQVQAMVHRGRKAIQTAITNGDIHRPQTTYGMDAERNEYAYYWREENIMELHDHLITVHYGRPRNDGLITPGPGLPTRAELRAMIRQGTVFYVKDDDGNFVPTWDAENF